jgi:hypothetical protein
MFASSKRKSTNNEKTLTLVDMIEEDIDIAKNETPNIENINLLSKTEN